MRSHFFMPLSLMIALTGCTTDALHDKHQHAAHTSATLPAPTSSLAHSLPNSNVHNRQAIVATKEEYAHVIGDMQKMLASIQGITGALAVQDWATVHQLSTALRPEHTMANPDTAAVSFHKKIPADWRALGGPMHKGFSALADEAAMGKRTEVALKLLSNTMAQCVACHSTYALKVSP